MLPDSLNAANEEIKRADHLIYVSLKYTRTADVIKTIIERLINAFNFGCQALLEHAKEERRITQVPTLPMQRVELVKKLYPHHKFQQFMPFFLLLRKVDKARFTRSKEYRRHVSMTATVDNTQIEITIDIVSDYFERTKEFVHLVEYTLGGGIEE